jgi:hypothetical protein
VELTWDPKKATANKKKHGVHFAEAVTVFGDPLALYVQDELYDERTIMIGMSARRLTLFVVLSRRRTKSSESSARGGPRRASGRAMKKGTHKKTKEPSLASLREMPEVDLKRAKVQRNPYARRVAAEGITVNVGRGRPKKGSETGPTIPRSVRFPAAVWKHLEERAKAEGIPLHAALRAAVLAWIK